VIFTGRFPGPRRLVVAVQPLVFGDFAALARLLLPVGVTGVGERVVKVDQRHLVSGVGWERQPGRPGRADGARVDRHCRDAQRGGLPGRDELAAGDCS
jgi:hypothetical protein